MKNKFLILFFLIFPLFLFSQNNNQNISVKNTVAGMQRVGENIVNIEINVNNVDIDFQLHNENFIAFKIEQRNEVIEVVENKKKLQFYTVKSPTTKQGKIHLFIPKDFLLESCRIQATDSIIKIEKIKSIYFVVSAISSEIQVEKSKFKNILFTTALSKINFSSGIVAVADFCVNSTKGIINIAEKQENCNLFMSQIQNEFVTFNGKTYTNLSLAYAPKKPKKYITLSASFSDLAVNFISPIEDPKENFDQYGISEFGPTPPPNLVDPVSNFLPKQ